MKVLVLSQHFWPESFRINEVVESLVRAKCEVTVLTGQPNYPDGAIFQGFRAFDAGSEPHGGGYTIVRVPLVPRGRGGALRLVLNYLSFLLAAGVLGPWLLRRRQFDIVFVYATSPILQAIPAILIAFLKRAKLVAWVQDLWPQSLEVTGFVRNPKALAMVAALVRWIYRRCDLLLVQSRAFMEPVRDMSGPVEVRYHPNPGSPADAVAVSTESAALVLRQGFNVVFAGNLGKVQALHTVLDAAELLLPEENIRLVLVGSGSLGDWLSAEVVRRGLFNVQLAGRFAPAAMPGIFAQASALLVSLSRSPAMSQTVPSKVQTYLAAGKPIIASLDGEGSRVITEAGAGLACPAEDPRALADAVLALQSMATEVLARMGEAGRSYYLAHFDQEVLATKLVGHFSDVLTSSKAQP